MSRIEIDSRARCGGKLKIIASIEEPQAIAKILSHLERTAPQRREAELPFRGAAGIPGVQFAVWRGYVVAGTTGQELSTVI